ncbi:hypothetical protein [Collinsella tanakaei]|uniref:hypothetical protein n=1 Tax=Collinsella tanakaei TaxID=626935 RepID=UPI0022DEA31C|nr:hypothetical protein [Collinsella tanakaei]
MALTGNEPISADNIKDLVDANAIISGEMIATLDDMTSYFEKLVFTATSGISGLVINSQDCKVVKDDVSVSVYFSQSPEFSAGQATESVIKLPSEFLPPDRTLITSYWYKGNKPFNQYLGGNNYTNNGGFFPMHEESGEKLRLYGIDASYQSDWRSKTPLRDKVITIATLAKILEK